MKRKIPQILAGLLLVCIIITGFVYLPTTAESNQPADYSSEYNSGQRDVVCTSLSGTSVSSYYTDNYTYDNLSTLSSASLKDSLSKLMTDTHKYVSSYDDCHYLASRTDCQNEDQTVLLLYSSYVSDLDGWAGSTGIGWNREHVWPKSLGGNTTTGGGADLHHIRPADARINSTRNNNLYGYANNGSAATGSTATNGALGGYLGGYYEPLDNVKGDVARIVLYVYVRWGSEWGATDVEDVFQSVDVLLEWCEMDPVDTWEMGRNEVVQDIQGNRNVFIDYPEYAWLLFDEEIPNDMETPSGIAKGNSGGGSNEEQTTAKETTAEQTTEAIEETTEPGEENSEPRQTLYNNIYYGETLKFMFASATKPTVTYTNDDGDTVSLGIKPYVEDGEQLIVNGYPAWISTKGMPVQNIAMRISVTVGDRTETYSVLEYVYTRLYVSTDVNESERLMYNTLIDYAKKADVMLNGVEESDIDKQYLVKVTNGTIDGNTSSDLFEISDTPLANIDTYIEIPDGKKLVWEVSVTVDGTTSTETYSDEDIRNLAVAGHTVIKAKYIEDGSATPTEPVWKLVTDVSQLSVGDRIIIAAKDYDFALSTNQKTNNRGQTEITKSGDLLDSPSDSVQIITLEAGTVSGTFAFNVGESSYLYAESSTNNYLKTQSEIDDNSSWSITVSADGTAAIVAQGSNSRNVLKYNKSSSLFSCYLSTSDMLPVIIYVLTYN